MKKWTRGKQEAPTDSLYVAIIHTSCALRLPRSACLGQLEKNLKPVTGRKPEVSQLSLRSFALFADLKSLLAPRPCARLSVRARPVISVTGLRLCAAGRTGEVRQARSEDCAFLASLARCLVDSKLARRQDVCGIHSVTPPLAFRRFQPSLTAECPRCLVALAYAPVSLSMRQAASTIVSTTCAVWVRGEPR